jgi:hypothetical protein
LRLRRKRFAKHEAIYFVEPTETNIAQIISDFEDRSKALYAKIHLFTTSGAFPCAERNASVSLWLLALPASLFDKLSKSNCPMYLGSLVELNLLFFRA